MTESPSLITVLPACLKVCCRRMGSRAGSSSSATFSRRHGLPNLTAFSRLRRKSLSVSLTTSSALSFSCQQHICTTCKFLLKAYTTAVYTNQIQCRVTAVYKLIVSHTCEYSTLRVVECFCNMQWNAMFRKSWEVYMHKHI